MTLIVPNPPERWQSIFYRVLLIGGALAALLWLIARLRIVTVPMMVGFFIAWALHPVVVWLRLRRVPAFVALMGPLIVFGTLSFFALAIVIPTLGSQLLLASKALPARLEPTLAGLNPWSERMIGRRITDIVSPESLQEALQAALRDLAGPATSMVGWLLSSARDLLMAGGTVALIFIVAAFLIDDYDRIVASIGELVPPARRGTVFRILRRIDQTLMGFVGGELVLFALATVAFTSGLLLMSVPFAALVGPLAAVLYLVPYLGVLTGATLALALALLEAPSWGTFAGVLTVFGTFYTIDLLFITPRIIGGRVGLRPMVVLLGIIAGGELLGIVGILLAVPVLAVARILLLESIAVYRASELFLGPPSTPTDDVETVPVDGKQR